jgi:hypothetical protein
VFWVCGIRSRGQAQHPRSTARTSGLEAGEDGAILALAGSGSFLVEAPDIMSISGQPVTTRSMRPTTALEMGKGRVSVAVTAQQDHPAGTFGHHSGLFGLSAA